MTFDPGQFKTLRNFRKLRQKMSAGYIVYRGTPYHLSENLHALPFTETSDILSDDRNDRST